jgi:hypothetical protein
LLITVEKLMKDLVSEIIIDINDNKITKYSVAVLFLLVLYTLMGMSIRDAVNIVLAMILLLLFVTGLLALFFWTMISIISGCDPNFEEQLYLS